MTIPTPSTDKSPEQILEEASETSLRLSLEHAGLIDYSDPDFKKIVLSAIAWAVAHNEDPQTAQSWVSLGYIAGRLRGRKETHMATILGQEPDDA